MPRHTRISLLTRLKWHIFRLLERLSDLRGNSATGDRKVGQPAVPMPALWVFASTIGEVNAIEPFLRQLASRLSQLKLVLITDHPHYRDSYLARYPNAEVCVTRGHSADADALAAGYPPQILIVAEIPCWPADAPCRFSFAFVLEAKRRGATAFLVNGWLYHYAPPCRMDAIERKMFQADYLRAFDAIGVQTVEVRDRVITAGATPERVSVAGNIKFDAMQRADWTPEQARSPAMLSALIATGRPVIVAGCVTDRVEQELVLDAFVTVRDPHANALLVLAPRHPEVAEVMQSICQGLGQRHLSAVYRSAMTDVPISEDISCLVLDTIGELRDFYAAATVAHVGVDHNVLEPLAFGKPVTVRPGWEATYPSYPVYRMLMNANGLLAEGDPGKLGAIWLDLLGDPESYRNRIEVISTAVKASRGATKRHMDIIDPWL